MKTAAGTTSTRWQNIRYSGKCATYVQAVEAHPMAKLVKLGALADACHAGCPMENPPQWIIASRMLDTLDQMKRNCFYLP